jgi:hypothetical protein
MRRQSPSLIYASLYRQKIQDILDEKHVAPSKDLAAICESYLDTRQLYKVVFSDQVNHTTIEYEFVALVDNKYELLDLFIAYFKLYLYNIDEEKFYDLMQGIEPLSYTKFISDEPLILYGIKYQANNRTHKILILNSYWKHFRDGYRRGLDAPSPVLSGIANSTLKKCPPREFYTTLVTGTRVPSGWDFDTDQTFLLYKHEVWNYMNVNLGLGFSDHDSDSGDEDSFNDY